MRSTLLRLSFSLIVAIAGWLAQQAQAASPCSSCWPIPKWLGVACGCCPDDYCVKPLPPVECAPAQCCPDTYCPKPLPAVPCGNFGCSCDCYDIKPLPPVPCCSEPWYKCIPYCGGK